MCQVHQVSVCTCFCTRIFLALSSKLVVFSRSLCFFPHGKLNPHCRSECGIANNHTAQWTAQTGQLLIAPRKQLLALSIRYSHQITCLFFLPLLHGLVALFLARAKRGPCKSDEIFVANGFILLRHGISATSPLR